MKFKKVLAVALTAVFVVSLAACTSSGKTDEGTKSDKLTVAIWDSNQEPGLSKIMEGFTKESGIEVDIQVTPWKDFRETAKKLTKEDGSQYGFSMKPGNDQESWYSTIYAYGREVLNKEKTKSGFDNPKNWKQWG